MYYYLTRMAFGMASAPKIMLAIVKWVLEQNKEISVVSVEKVIEHLKQYGLETKVPVELSEARVLGLQIVEESGVQIWKSGNDLPVVKDGMSRRELFSVTGKLLGHYPVACWLRVLCSFVKRLANGGPWDDYVGLNAENLINDILMRLTV